MSSFYSVSPLLIEQSVGRDGKNLPPDVRTIQSMLNVKLPAPLLPLNVNGICDWFTINTIENYQRLRPQMANPSGKIEPGDATLRSLKDVPAKPSAGRKYTTSPNEVAVKTTTPTAREVVDMLLVTWPEIHPTGARTLTAQFMAETGGGQSCFNWNLGNVKSGADQPHIYLQNTWECRSKSVADADVANGKGLARIATADEIKKRHWKCPNTVVVFSPPHEQSRFRAYATLQEGAQRWLSLHQRIAKSNSAYLKALQAADVAAAAKALWKAGYYTAAEADYASAMTDQKRILDRALGPLPPPWK